MSKEWSDMYGEVVWAKCAGYEWWPCYVYDPDKIPFSSQEVRKKAAKVKGKQYAVYFYGDTSYSFAAPKNVVLYSEESNAKYANTKHSKKYMDQFEAGKKIAEAEVILDKNDRVNFHLQGSAAEPISAKKVVGRSKKDDATVSDELYFSEDKGKRAAHGIKESDDISGDGEDAQKKSRKRKKTADVRDEAAVGKKARGQKTLLVQRNGGGEEPGGEEEEGEGEEGDNCVEREDEDESSASDSYGGTEDDEVVVVKPPKKPASRRSSMAPMRIADRLSSSASTSASACPSTSIFAGESLVDRLVRFGKILAFCSADGASAAQHLARIVKVFDKLDAVEVTLSDLVKSGIGKTVTELRKSSDATVRDRAQALRAKWKAIVQSEGGDAQASSEAVRPQQDRLMDLSPQEKPAHATGKSETPLDSQVAPPPSAPASSSFFLSAAQNQARGRAVRLLREAAATAGNADTSEGGMSCGELAFAVEKAAMEAFGAAQPRYFEFLSRYAIKLKNGTGALLGDDFHASVLASFDFMSADVNSV